MGRPKLRKAINEDYEVFGKRLAELRKARRLTQEELANELGLSKTSIAEYETGIARVQLSTIKSFSEYFKVSVDYLLDIRDTIDIEIKEPALDTMIFIESAPVLSQTEREELRKYAEFLISKRKSDK